MLRKFTFSIQKYLNFQNSSKIYSIDEFINNTYIYIYIYIQEQRS
jgi:hypothetical protein